MLLMSDTVFIMTPTPRDMIMLSDGKGVIRHIKGTNIVSKSIDRKDVVLISLY